MLIWCQWWAIHDQQGHQPRVNQFLTQLHAFLIVGQLREQQTHSLLVTEREIKLLVYLKSDIQYPFVFCLGYMTQRKRTDSSTSYLGEVVGLCLRNNRFFKFICKPMTMKKKPRALTWPRFKHPFALTFGNAFRIIHFCCHTCAVFCVIDSCWSHLVII